MALKEVIKEIEKLSTPDRYRLKEFFTKSLASYTSSELVVDLYSEQKKELKPDQL
jgi:hypothetical protein